MGKRTDARRGQCALGMERRMDTAAGNRSRERPPAGLTTHVAGESVPLAVRPRINSGARSRRTSAPRLRNLEPVTRRIRRRTRPKRIAPAVRLEREEREAVHCYGWHLRQGDLSRRGNAGGVFEGIRPTVLEIASLTANFVRRSQGFSLSAHGLG